MNSQFKQNQGSKVTSCLYIEDDSQGILDVIIQGSTFANNQGVLTNEIYFGTIKSLLVDSCQWKSDYQPATLSARFISRDQLGYQVTIQNSVFNCTENTTSINNVLTQGYETSLLNRVSLIELIGAASDDSQHPTSGNGITDQFSGNRYFQCQEAYKGGIFNIQLGAMVIDINSLYTANSAYYGGIAYVSGMNS